MTRTVFDRSHIAAWSAALHDRKPSEITELEWTGFPQVEAFRPVALHQGIAFKMRCRNGEEIAFAINPIAARHLAACIITMGQGAGWLDEVANVIVPPAPALDA